MSFHDYWWGCGQYGYGGIRSPIQLAHVHLKILQKKKSNQSMILNTKNCIVIKEDVPIIKVHQRICVYMHLYVWEAVLA